MTLTGEIVDNSATAQLKAAIWKAAQDKSVQIVAALILILAVMAKIEFGGPAILDNDGYYHIRWSKMLRESAPHLPSFTWLPLTTLNASHYVDHHFLFHVFLMPFTFGDLRIGAKLAAVLFSSLALTSLFFLLVAYRVPYRWLWLVPLVASSEPFLYRMSMTRAPSLSVVLLALGAYLILKRRWVWLGIAGYLFVLLYSLFPLLFAFAGIYSIAVYLADRRIDLWAPLAAGSGILAGLIANPYFPKNLILFKEHLLDKLTSNYSVDVGIEWYPYDTWVIVTGSAVAFILFLVALFFFEFKNSRQDIKPLFFLLISTMLLVLAFKSRRFIEYWPPFSVLGAAFTIAPRIAESRFLPIRRVRDGVIGALAAAAVTVVMIVALAFNVFEARKDVAAEPSPYAYRGACEWLKTNTPEGSMVFNTDWDEFPELFYYDPHNKYIAGLDPTYLYDEDHDLWKTYADVTLGNVDDPGPVIRDRFGANYVFTSSEQSDFKQAADDSGGFETVYSDQYATVMRVRRADEKQPQQQSQDSNDSDDDNSVSNK
ncbi:MAG TPA: hypothetical protein VI756_05000 [Blastocatellia bacterium]